MQLLFEVCLLFTTLTIVYSEEYPPSSEENYELHNSRDDRAQVLQQDHPQRNVTRFESSEDDERVAARTFFSPRYYIRYDSDRGFGLGFSGGRLGYSRYGARPARYGIRPARIGRPIRYARRRYPARRVAAKRNPKRRVIRYFYDRI